MNRSSHISPLQLFFLTVFFIFGGTVLRCGAYGASDAAWIAGLCASLLGLLFALWLYTAGVRGGHRSLPARIRRRFGVPGRIFLAVYAVFLLCYAALELYRFGVYLRTFSLPHLPAFLPAALMALFCFLAALRGLQGLGRTAVLLSPALLLPLILLLPLASSLLPPLPVRVDVLPFFASVLASFLSPFADLSLFLFLFPQTVSRSSPRATASARAERTTDSIAPENRTTLVRQALSPFIWGYLLGGIYLTLTVLREQSNLGASLLTLLPYPATRVAELTFRYDLQPLFDLSFTLFFAIRCSVIQWTALHVLEGCAPKALRARAQPLFLAAALAVMLALFFRFPSLSALAGGGFFGKEPLSLSAILALALFSLFFLLLPFFSPTTPQKKQKTDGR